MLKQQRLTAQMSIKKNQFEKWSKQFLILGHISLCCLGILSISENVYAESSSKAQSTLGLKHSGMALPDAQKPEAKKVVPRNMQVVKPPKSSEFYDTNEKEKEYEKLLDQEISDLYRLSQQYRSSKNRGEIWLRLAERYKEKSKMIELKKQIAYDKALADFVNKKIKVKPKLDLKLAREFNVKAIELYQWFVKDFPQDPKMDQALFFLGYHNFELGQTQVGENYYKRLVREYPDSEYVDESHFALGEYYFENEQWREALDNYELVIRKRRVRLLTFAYYKSAWCLYRTSKTDAALKALEKVIKLSGGPQEIKAGKNKGVNHLRLAVEAIRDYVPFYAESGEYKQAAHNFYNVVQDEVKAFSMVENLARVYAENGNREAANYLYKQLISRNPVSDKAADYQFQVVLSYETSDPKAYKEEMITWLENFGPGSAWAKENAKNAKLIEDTQKVQEAKLRNRVLLLHQTAQNSHTQNSQQLAAEAYQLYAKYFYNNPEHGIEMTFFNAELLFDMNNFEGASRLYTYVIDRTDIKNKYFEKAVINNLLALENGLPKTEDIDKTRGKSLELIPFSEPVEKFEKGALVYLKNYPKGEKASDIQRRLAYFYYSFNQFDKAMPLFEKVLIEKPNTENADISGNLLIDIYKLKNDIIGMGDKAAQLLTYPSVANSRFGAKLREIVEATSYTKADKLAEGKDYVQAAHEYEKFAATSKALDLVTAAQYKAADNYEKAGDLVSSIRLHGLVLSKQTNDTKVVAIQNDSRNSLARLYTQTAQLEPAAKLYAGYAATNTKDAKAVNGFNNAAVIYDALNNFTEAEVNYDQYFKYSRSKDRAEVLFLKAEMYKRQNKLGLAVQNYEQYATYGTDHEHMIKSSFMVGMLSLKLSKPDKAKSWFAKTVEMQKPYRKQQNEGVSYAAEAKFRLASDKLNTLRGMKYTANPKQQEKLTKDILAFQNQYVKQDMAEVIRYDYGPMIIAALASTGQMFEIIAYNFSKVPPGKDFSPEELNQFKQLIAQKVNEYRKQALDAYKLAVDKSNEIEVYTEWTQMARAGLNNIDPVQFPKQVGYPVESKLGLWDF